MEACQSPYDPLRKTSLALYFERSSAQNCWGNIERMALTEPRMEPFVSFAPYCALTSVVEREPPNTWAMPPARSSPDSVTILITPQNAFSPYSDDPGPRTISMRLMFWIGK